MRPFLKESGWRSEVEIIIRCECYANLHGQPKISGSSLDYFEKKKKGSLQYHSFKFTSQTRLQKKPSLVRDLAS